MKKLIILISAVAISGTIVLTGCTETNKAEYIAEETTAQTEETITTSVYEEILPEETTTVVTTPIPVVTTAETTIPETTTTPVETTTVPETTTTAPVTTTTPAPVVTTTVVTTPAPVPSNNTPAYSPDGIPLPKGYGQTGYDVYEKKGDKNFGNNWQAWGSQIEVPDYNSLTGKHNQMYQQGQANMQAVQDRHQAEMERMRQQFYERRGY